MAEDEELEALKSVARDFFERWSSPDLVRTHSESDTGWNRSVWESMSASLGLQSLLVPESCGGTDAHLSAVCVVMEEMGRVLYCGPFLSSAVLAASLVGQLDAGDSALREIGAGRLVSVALTEDAGSWELNDLSTRATRSDVVWTLNGHKSYVLDGSSADLFLIVAQSDEGPAIFEVAGDAPGLAREELMTLDRTRRMSRLDLVDVPGRNISEGEDVEAVVRHALAVARVALAAEQLGAARMCLELAVDHVSTRFQFGRALGSFQAVKHKCADLVIALEQCRSALDNALWAWTDDRAEFERASALAAITCSETSLRAANDAMQLHGGLGFTWELPLHLYLRRAKTSEVLFGDPAARRLQLASTLAR